MATGDKLPKTGINLINNTDVVDVADINAISQGVEKLKTQLDAQSISTGIKVPTFQYTVYKTPLKDDLALIKAIWEELPLSWSGEIRLNSGLESTGLIQKYGRQEYGSALLYGYGKQSLSYYTLNNGVWKEYSLVTVDNVTTLLNPINTQLNTMSQDLEKSATELKAFGTMYNMSPAVLADGHLPRAVKYYGARSVDFNDVANEWAMVNLGGANSPKGMTGAFAYINTIHYSFTGNRMQIAYPYSSTIGSPQFRLRFNDVWTEWEYFTPNAKSFGISMETGYTFEAGATIEKLANIAFINLSISGTFTGGNAVKVGKLSDDMRPISTIRTPATWTPLATTNVGRVYIDAHGQVWAHLANGSATQVSFSITYKTLF